MLQLGSWRNSKVAVADKPNAQGSTLSPSESQRSLDGGNIPNGKIDWKVIAAYVACAVIWGTTWYSVKLCIQPGGYQPWTAAAIRFTLSGAILAFFWLATIKKVKVPTRENLKWITVAGLFSGCSYGLVYFSMNHLSG